MVDSGSEDKVRGVRWWREREGTASPTVTFGRWAALGMEVIPLDMGGRMGEEEKRRGERGQAGRNKRRLLNCWPEQLLLQAWRHHLGYHHHTDRPRPHTVSSRARGTINCREHTQ